MNLSILHETTFHYSLPARSNINEVRLAPEENDRQKPGHLEIVVEPEPESEMTATRDLFGNLVHAFEVEKKHGELKVLARSHVETLADRERAERAQSTQIDFEAIREDDSVHEFLVDSKYVSKDPDIWKEAVDVSIVSEPTWGSLAKNLSERVFDTCRWEEQLIHRATTATEIRESRIGTCQDFAHLLIGYCRALGIPARYVSGYLYDPGLDADGEASYTGASVSHAWVDFFTPEIGWVGVDPTNRCWVDEQYVSVAFGRDYGDVAPIRGSLLGGGPKRSIDVKVEVKRCG